MLTESRVLPGPKEILVPKGLQVLPVLRVPRVQPEYKELPVQQVLRGHRVLKVLLDLLVLLDLKGLLV